MFQTSPDGNVSLSTMTFVPSVRDSGKYLECRAGDQQSGEGGLQDGWRMTINCELPVDYVQIITKYQLQKHPSHPLSMSLILFVLIPDVPQASLRLGTSLNGSNIKEADDVYFECNVRANPSPYKITWRRNVSAIK